MLLRKEQRGLELAELRKKGKLIKNSLERDLRVTTRSSPSWLDRQVLSIGVQSIGVAFPLSDKEDFLGAATSSGASAFAPSSVRAFLFSIQAVNFATHRYERGALDIEDFSFQFVPDFDQSLPFHFEGRSHNTHNRLRLPRMNADIHTNLAGKTRRIEAGAHVDGLELDLDTSITSYVFSLIDVYRRGKDRIEKLAPGQAQANLDALSARIASAQSVGSHLATASSSNIKFKFSCQSGRVRLYPTPDRDGRSPQVASPRLPSLPSTDGTGSSFVINTLRLPELVVDGEFQAASASEKFTGSIDTVPVAKLKIEASVRASKNTIRPSVLPLLVEVVRDVERRMSKQPSKSAFISKGGQDLSSEEPVENLSTVLPTTESFIGSHLHAQFTLKVEASQLELTCQPDVNVVAALDWQSSQVILNVEPGVRQISVLGEIGGINVSVRHEFLKIKALTAEARNLIFNVVLGRAEHSPPSYSVASLSVTTKTDVEGKFNARRLQDLLCFKAVWLDRIPVVEGRPKTDGLSTPLPNPSKIIASDAREPVTSSRTVMVVTAIVQTLKLELDLGPAITKLELAMNPLVVNRKRSATFSEFSVYVEKLSLVASQLLAGQLSLPHLLFKTKRGDESGATSYHLSQMNQLEVQINTGALEITLQHDQMELFACKYVLSMVIGAPEPYISFLPKERTHWNRRCGMTGPTSRAILPGSTWTFHSLAARF